MGFYAGEYGYVKLNPFTWKWLPIGDPLIDYFISVDIKKVSIFKSILLDIDKWMNQNKDFFIIRGEIFLWTDISINKINFFNNTLIIT